MRRIGRIFGWGALALLSVATALLLVNAFDEPLTPEVRALLEKPDEPLTRQQNMFYAAVGFRTAGQDMEQAGWERVQAINAALRAGKSWQDAESIGAQGTLKTVGDGECLSRSSDLPLLLDFLQAHKSEAEALLKDNSKLMQRYADLASYQRFAATTPADVLAAFLPAWGGISCGKRLWMLDLAQRVATGHLDSAITWLQQDTLFWRHMIAEKRIGLIGKMVMLAQLRTNFRTAAQLVHDYPMNAVQLSLLRDMAKPLTSNERSLASVFEDEFRWQASELRKLGASSQLLERLPNDEPPTIFERLSVFVQKRFYLRNATINLVYGEISKQIEFDGHACDRYAMDKAAGEKKVDMTWLAVRNPTGKIIVDQSTSVLHNYTGRMCDLQGFQRLLDLQLQLHQNKVADDQVEAVVRSAGPDYADPFTGGPMQWLPLSRALSFGALDKRDQGMLPWPI
ncbi:MAG: hypothetical protein JWR07_2522 [Nevskia sp.]|nr:hypothetical protein [Nevskia sp.]